MFVFIASQAAEYQSASSILSFCARRVRPTKLILLMDPRAAKLITEAALALTRSDATAALCVCEIIICSMHLQTHARPSGAKFNIFSLQGFVQKGFFAVLRALNNWQAL